MIDTKKIRLMTKLAIYEKREGHEDIEMAKYYKADYVRMHILKTIIAITFGCVLLLVLIAVYNMEFLLDEALVLNYKLLGEKIIGIYLLLIVIYVGLVLIGYSIKYTNSRLRLAKYYRALGRIKKIAEKEERRKEMEQEEREDSDI